MTRSLILTIDVGTSSMRAALWTLEGLSVYGEQQKYSPTYLGDGAVEQDPSAWLNALVRLTRGAVEFASTGRDTVDAVSVTAQRSSVIPVDSEGTPLSVSVMWQDRRSQAICDRLIPHAATIYSKCGAVPNTVFLGPKISWIHENRPEIYAKAHKLIAIPDLLLYFITGRFVTDTTYASRSLLMDLATREWNEDLLELFDVDSSKLSEIIQPGSIAGYSSTSFLALTNLKAGTPIISAGGDQQCAALGSGIIGEGRIQANTGTGSFVIAASDSIRLHPGMGLSCGCSAIPEKYILEASILTTAAIYQWFNHEFFREDTYETINREAVSSRAGANGLLLLPYFEGRGSPEWNSRCRGVFYNLSLGSTRGDMARAILEGIAAEIAENIDLLEGMVGPGCEVFISGGLTKASIFNQIQADMYERQVSLAVNGEASSSGAWMSAVVALGVQRDYADAWKLGYTKMDAQTFVPNKERTVLYSELRARARVLYQALCQCC